MGERKISRGWTRVNLGSICSLMGKSSRGEEGRGRKNLRLASSITTDNLLGGGTFIQRGNHDGHGIFVIIFCLFGLVGLILSMHSHNTAKVMMMMARHLRLSSRSCGAIDR